MKIKQDPNAIASSCIDGVLNPRPGTLKDRCYSFKIGALYDIGDGSDQVVVSNLTEIW
jgi:hypothetical protein